MEELRLIMDQGSAESQSICVCVCVCACLSVLTVA